MPLLEIKHLKKRYKLGAAEIDALRGISLSVERGEFISIMGPSGSGKSSLLQLVGCLDHATEGSISFEDRAITDLTDYELSLFRRRKLGFVFQFFNLLPSLTALENVALPLMLDNQSFSQIKPKALLLLSELGLQDRVNHIPSQLSGGEMQRVAIARALVSDPLLILADEPTGNLDSKTGSAILEILQKLAKEKGQTVIMVTHDLKAASYGTRLIRLRDGVVESQLTLPASNEGLLLQDQPQ